MPPQTDGAARQAVESLGFAVGLAAPTKAKPTTTAATVARVRVHVRVCSRATTPRGAHVVPVSVCVLG